MASLVCGSFIIESVFGWPGIGSFAMEAIGKRDYPIIMAYVMAMSVERTNIKCKSVFSIVFVCCFIFKK